METKLTNMTGEQLLLLRILGGAEAQAAVEVELDHRARAALPGTVRRRPGQAKPVASVSPQLAA